MNGDLVELMDILYPSESHGTPPNGGGGGEGYCRNVTVKDVYMEDIMHPIAVDTSSVFPL